MGVFQFEYEMEISTRPEKSIGSDEDWERATQALMRDAQGQETSLSISMKATALFTVPKIDVKLKDALGRRWQCATIQVDFAMPERFDLTYVGSDGEHAPARDASPRDPRGHGAVHRGPDRALRRGLSRMACAGPGHPS